MGGHELEAGPARVALVQRGGPPVGRRDVLDNDQSPPDAVVGGGVPAPEHPVALGRGDPIPVVFDVEPAVRERAGRDGDVRAAVVERVRERGRQQLPQSVGGGEKARLLPADGDGPVARLQFEDGAVDGEHAELELLVEGDPVESGTDPAGDPVLVVGVDERPGVGRQQRLAVVAGQFTRLIVDVEYLLAVEDDGLATPLDHRPEPLLALPQGPARPVSLHDGPDPAGQHREVIPALILAEVVADPRRDGPAGYLLAPAPGVEGERDILAGLAQRP